MSGQQWGPPGQNPPNQGPPAGQQWGPPAGQYGQGTPQGIGPYPPQTAGQYPPPQGPPPGQYYGQQGPYGPPPGQYAGQQYAGSPYGAGQQGFGWGPMPQPPKKRRGLGLVVLAVVGGLAVLAAVVVGVGFSLTGKDDSTATPPVASPSYEPTVEDSPTVPTATSEPPTSVPATTRPPTSPPSPKPAPVLTPYQIAATNKLYRTGTQASVGCRESRVGLGNQANSTAYYRSLKACLDRAWRRHVTSAGYQFRPPGLLTIATNGSSPCGTAIDALAFYCPSNHTMYMKADLDIQYWKQSQTFSRAVASHAAAHEYGHAVQELTGILQASRRLGYNAATPALELEMQRRKELQASCFGNLFLGANKASYGIRGTLRTQWLYVVNNTGDRPELGARDHGSTRNHGIWSRRAFDRPNLAVCNTFTAPSSQVS
ncbi:neutral zinc metallopeptidase [Kribbella sp. DT2]|uniref:neutral zinc metallopeptidase n=1 Tax=Kribbella sp. DT2 TaxID=3393427 RepID=UPI003CEEE0C1